MALNRRVNIDIEIRDMTDAALKKIITSTRKLDKEFARVIARGQKDFRQLENTMGSTAKAMGALTDKDFKKAIDDMAYGFHNVESESSALGESLEWAGLKGREIGRAIESALRPMETLTKEGEKFAELREPLSQMFPGIRQVVEPFVRGPYKFKKGTSAEISAAIGPDVEAQALQTRKREEAAVRESQRAMEKGEKALSKFVRRMGFAGFIMSFTLQRISNSFIGLAKSVALFSLKAADTEKVISDLEQTLSALAIADRIGGEEEVAAIVEEFEAMYDAAASLQATMAEINLEVVPFKTVMMEVTDENMKEIRDAIHDAKEDLPDLADTWESIIEKLQEPISDAIVSILDSENIVKVSGGMETLAGWTGEFVGGIILGAEDIVKFSDFLQNAAPWTDDLAAAFGRLTPKLIIFGMFVTVVSSLATWILLLRSAVTTLAVKLGVLGTVLGVVGKFFLPILAAMVGVETAKNMLKDQPGYIPGGPGMPGQTGFNVFGWGGMSPEWMRQDPRLSGYLDAPQREYAKTSYITNNIDLTGLTLTGDIDLDEFFDRLESLSGEQSSEYGSNPDT